MNATTVSQPEKVVKGGEYVISGRGNNTLAIRILAEPHVGEVNGILYAVVIAYRIRRTGDRASFGERNVYTRRVTDFTPF